MRIILLFSLTVASAWAGVRLDPPLVRQVRHGCGAASLAMVVGYWERRIPSESAASAERIYAALSETDTGGIRLAKMKQYLLEQGFHAFTLRSSAGQIEEHLSKRRPIIVGLRYGSKSDLHFVVVSGFDQKGFWLHDPARSKPKRVKRSKFDKLWSAGDGWALLAVPKQVP